MRWISKILACLTFVTAIGAHAEQKVVLITGSSGGIGLAAVQAFQERGWKVWAGTRKPIAELPQFENVQWIPLDVTNEQMVEESLNRIFCEDGAIHALVNNAGATAIGLEEAIPLQEAEKLFDVNFFGCLRLIQKVIPQMRAQQAGHIINISSLSGIRAIPGLGVYAASKFALEGLSEALAVTLFPWNIQVSLIEPGSVKNDFVQSGPLIEEPSDNPFAAKLSRGLANRLAQLATKGQECEEIGRLIADVAEMDHPDFRYQTTQKGRETADKKFVDRSGNAMRDEQIVFFKSIVE